MHLLYAILPYFIFGKAANQRKPLTVYDLSSIHYKVEF